MAIPAETAEEISPPVATGNTLERADHLGCDPTGVESPRLRLNEGAIHATFESRRVKGDAIRQCLGTREGMGITPGHAGQSALLVGQRPITRRTFPLAVG